MVYSSSKQSFSLTAKPTALVAGGAGFVGSFLCQSLLFQGCRVIAVDNLSSGKKSNLSLCWHHKDFSFFHHDITKPFPENFFADYIFHVAGMENRPGAKLQHLLVNSQGTQQLLILAQRCGAKFLLASTASIPAVQGRIFSKITGHVTDQKKLASARAFAEQLVVEFCRKQGDARIVRLGQLYGPRMDLTGAGEVETIFAHYLVQKQPVKVFAEKHVCPLFISDAVFGVMKLMFSVSSVPGHVYELNGSEEVSLYDLCHRVGKAVGQRCRLDFLSGSRKNEAELKQSTSKLSFRWEPVVSLDEGIRRTFDFFSRQLVVDETKTEPVAALPAETTREYSSPAQPKKNISSRTRSRPLKTVIRRVKPVVSTKLSLRTVKALVPLGLFLFLAVSPLVPLLVKTGLTVWHGWQSYRSYQAENFDQWVSRAEKAYRWSQGLEQEAERVIQLVPWLEQEIDLSREAWYIRRFAYLNTQAAQLSLELQQWNTVIFQGSDGGVLETASLEAGLEKIWWELAYLESDLNQAGTLPLGLQWLEGRTGFRLTPAKLAQFRLILHQAKEMVPLLPQLLGFEGEKTYALLLQNNMELRPTGGFIGSFGLVTFTGGRMADLEIYDVYDADGQLKGHIEPPAPIREYLNEASWFLRDSNWDPNFPTSAQRASWFLEKSMGRSVDGVVGINLFFVEELLAQLGPIQLADYQEEVTSDNVFWLAEKYAETDFFPGSKEKKDFLGSLVRAVLGRLEQGEVKAILALVRTISTAGEQKEIAFFFQDEATQRLFGTFNWDGSLRTPVCFDPVGCRLDYLQVVEANVGVNKVNYYLEREMNLTVRLDQPAVVDHQLQIVYRNTSGMDDLYGGDYKNYLRLYLPLGTVIEEARVNGAAVPEDEITATIEAGKTVIGFLVITPAGGERKVEIRYSQSAPQERGYTLLWQRQSGSDRSPFMVTGFVDSSEMPSLLVGAEVADEGFWHQGVLERDFWLGF